MKKRFNLQLFADGAESTENDTGAEVGTEQEKPTEQKQEPETPTEPKTYTQEELDRIVKDRLAREKKEQAKKVAEAEKLAKMDAQQKAEYERDELQKELDELKRDKALAEMSKTARKMLSDEGINISDELLSRLVTTDAEETKAAVDGFKKLFKAAVEDAVKERAKGTTPKIITNNGNAMSEIDKRIAKYE
jgi:hypothetical protein